MQIVIIAPVPQLRTPRIWGTFSASGGVGATTLTFYLARIAARSGLRVLLIETDIRAPLREIVGGEPPFWEEYRNSGAIAMEALPRPCQMGFSFLTRRRTEPIVVETFENLVRAAIEHFDLILIDQPIANIPEAESLLVVENSLPSLIGLNVLREIHRPKIIVLNKFSPRLKKSAAIKRFILDERVFQIGRAVDLQLTLGFGITRRSSKENERILNEIVTELIR